MVPKNKKWEDRCRVCGKTVPLGVVERELQGVSVGWQIVHQRLEDRG